MANKKRFFVLYELDVEHQVGIAVIHANSPESAAKMIGGRLGEFDDGWGYFPVSVGRHEVIAHGVAVGSNITSFGLAEVPSITRANRS